MTGGEWWHKCQPYVKHIWIFIWKVVCPGMIEMKEYVLMVSRLMVERVDSAKEAKHHQFHKDHFACHDKNQHRIQVPFTQCLNVV